MHYSIKHSKYLSGQMTSINSSCVKKRELDKKFHLFYLKYLKITLSFYFQELIRF